jgi:hypothetical protein
MAGVVQGIFLKTSKVFPKIIKEKNVSHNF